MAIRFDEKGKFFTDIITKDPIPATIQTQSHRILGNIHVRPEERVKDTLNNADPFLAITDATVFGPNEEILFQSDFLALNQNHIVWVILDVGEETPNRSAS